MSRTPITLTGRFFMFDHGEFNLQVGDIFLPEARGRMPSTVKLYDGQEYQTLRLVPETIEAVEVSDDVPAHEKWGIGHILAVYISYLVTEGPAIWDEEVRCYRPPHIKNGRQVLREVSQIPNLFHALMR